MILIEEHRNGETMKEHTNDLFFDNLACQKTLFSSFIASASMHEEKIKKMLSEIAIADPAAFTALVEKAKAAL